MASTSSPAVVAASHAVDRSDLELNAGKLQSAVDSGQGEIYILQWLAKAEAALKELPQDTLLGMQAKIEETYLRLVCPLELDAVGDAHAASHSRSAAHAAEQNAVPRMGRPARHIAARSLVALYERAETRSLYETMQALMRIAGEEGKGKALPEKEARASSLYIAGELFLAVGHNVMSQFIALLTLCQRLARNTAYPVLVRYNALNCLAKVLRNGGKSLNEQTYRDVSKTLRYALSDEAGAIARAAAGCYMSLLDTTDYIASHAEMDALLTATFRAMDTADYDAKRGLSKLVASLLAQSQKAGARLRPPKPRRKKSSKPDEASSDDEAGPASSSAQAPGAARVPLLAPKAMLERILAQLMRSTSSKAARCAILDVYATIFEEQGPAWIHANYDIILKHLIEDVPAGLANVLNRADLHSTRLGLSYILRSVIGERMLDEPAQVGAIEEISTSYLKRWPILTPGQTSPSRATLVMAFNETAGLLTQLGSAPSQVVDSVLEPAVRCLSHPSHSVQVSAAWCLRTLCLVDPLLLRSSIDKTMTNLDRDITSLRNAGERGGADLPKRAVGHARGLGALISAIPQQPLYVSFDISGKMLDLALQILKDSAEHSLTISAVEIQVAWILLGALMTLGPEFTKLHLTKLLNMWRSALPRLNEGPTSRSDAEWGFLLHVRECTLGCIYAFLLSSAGSSILTLDVARRIIALLSHALSFINAFAAQHPTLSQEHVPGTERGGTLTLLDREQMVRRRVFQCFAALVDSPALEVMQEALIGACVQTFADPDRHIGSTAQAAIAASTGSFVSVWQLSDGYAAGTTSLLCDEQCRIASNVKHTHATDESNSLNRDAAAAYLDSLQRRPINGALEFDPLVLYIAGTGSNIPAPAPPATGVIDSAIEIFAKLMPFQKRDTQIGAMESLLALTQSAKLDKNPARRMAIQVNACVATLGLLRVAMQPTTQGRSAAGFRNERLTIATRALLIELFSLGDTPLRSAASEAFGRLATLAGSQAMATQVQILVEHVVSNRSPNVRAGCASAFGYIYQEVGGLATGPLTKTVVDILLSLTNDPHPMVHFAALRGLRDVIDAASLSYSPFMQSTLGMLVKLYMMSTHEAEGGSAGSVNLRADLPATQAICQVLDALIGIIGPDLQESTKVRTLSLVLLNELSRERDEGTVVESTKATQHFVLFASQHMDLVTWILTLQGRLKSRTRPLRIAAINAFYHMLQRNALLVSKTCGDALVEEFFVLLDDGAAADAIKQVLSSWLIQTAHLSPTSWIELCQRVTQSTAGHSKSKAAKSTKQASQIGVLQDEEAAAIDLGDDAQAQGGRLQSRWRTQLYALQCLHEVLVAVRRAEKLEHFATPTQQTQLSSRVGDLIKMAFTASTSNNLEIRLEGLTVLHDVINYFRKARDPDFEEALLLEQHQAPIAAALTPAFLADSFPEVVGKALQVCATFVGCGVVREAEKLGRILKILTRALESCRDADMTQLGDVEGLSANAAMMLRIAVYDAWAQLQSASTQQSYITSIVEPHVASLSKAWIDTLAEYSHMRADPEGVGMGATGFISPMLDSPYASLVRAALLPYHQRSWPIILDAIASLMARDSEAVAIAMEGDAHHEHSSFRSEPTTHFFPLYGLSFEALATASGSQREEDTVRKTLLALRFLCRPRFAGSALLRDELFDELVDLCYRIVVSQGAKVQTAAVNLLASIASNYQDRLLLGSDANTLDEDSATSTKLAVCLRLPLFTISFARTKTAALSSRSTQRADLIKTAFSAFLAIVAIFPETRRQPILEIGIKAYSDLLRDEGSDADLVGPTLVSLKELSHVGAQGASESFSKVIHGFLSDCLNTLDSVRSRSGAIAFSKSKNAILSIVVVITSLPENVVLSHAVLESYCYELTTQLRRSDDDEGLQIALTALNCVKTILLASSRGSADAPGKALGPSLAFCVGQLLTNMVQALVAFQASSLADIDASTVRIVEETLKTLTGFVSVGTDDAQRARIAGAILPTLALYLYDQDDDEDAEERASAARLQRVAVHQALALARQYPAVFRTVLGLADAETRSRVETSIKKAVGLDSANAGSRDAGAAARAEAKTIELRSFG